MTFWDANDTAFISTTLGEIAEAVEQPIVVYSFGTVSYTGTAAEAGDPPSVTVGTRATTGRLESVTMKDVEKTAGKWQANDRFISTRGSFTKVDFIGFDTGTYKMIDGPWRIFMGSNVSWEGVCREVQS